MFCKNLVVTEQITIFVPTNTKIGKMEIKTNIRVTIRRMDVGDVFAIPYSEMKTPVVRNAASLVTSETGNRYSVNKDDGKEETRVTRIS